MSATLLLLVSLARADAQDSYEAAIAASRAGDQVAAEQQLREALDAGARDPAVYHGLGDALYRQGRLGLAITAWSRGQQLAPLNGDLGANLDHARKQTRDRIDPPVPALGPFFWQRSLSTGQSGGLASLALTAALSGLLAMRARPAATIGRFAARLRGLWLALGLLGLLLGLSTVTALRAGPAAVVIVAQVTARSTPGPDAVDLFTLHEGAVIGVRESTADAARVVLPDGRKGWIAWSALASTDPAAPFPAAVL